MQQQDECKEHQPMDSLGAELYDRYAVAIFAFVRLYTTSWEDAEDVVLDVFTKALEHDNLSWLMEKQQFAWLRSAAYNKVMDGYRQVARTPVVPIEQVMEMALQDESLTPERIVLRREELERLYEAIGKLTLLQQQMLRLRFGDGLRFADIALLLDKSEEGMRKLYSRTLARLRMIYQQQ